MAHKVEQRQNVILIKQLQNQVKTLQGVPITDTVPPLPSTPSQFSPGDGNRSRSRIDPQKVSSVKEKNSKSSTKANEESSASEKEEKKNNEENVILENDVLIMGLKLGMLQQENFELEQQNQAFRADLKQLREESAKKSRVIAKQLRGVKKKKQIISGQIMNLTKQGLP